MKVMLPINRSRAARAEYSLHGPDLCSRASPLPTCVQPAMDIDYLEIRSFAVGHLPVIRVCIDQLGIMDVLNAHLPRHPLAKASDAGMHPNTSGSAASSNA